MKSLGLAALLIFSLGACVVLPVPMSEVVQAGRHIGESDLGFIEKKRTTRDNVAKQLGPATVWLESQRIAVYGLVKTAGVGAVWIIASPGGVVGGVLPVIEREALFIAFDQSDTAIDLGRGKVPMGVTWLRAALDWGRSKGLELAQPRRKFAEIALPPQRSVIYFYRPRDIQHWFPGRESLLFGLDPFAEVYLDSTLLGQIKWKTYLPITLDAGTYDFRIAPYMDYNLKLEYHSGSIQMTVHPGLAYFVDIRIEAGTGFVGAMVSQRSREEAMPLLQTLRETW